MSAIRIIPTTQEVKYKGILFPINSIKPHVPAFVDHTYMVRFAINRKFNSQTGNIDYKYAWDSLLHQLMSDGVLKKILDLILEADGEEE